MYQKNGATFFNNNVVCPICKNSTRNATHMETVHKTEIVPYMERWKAIKDNFDYEEKKQKKKNAIMHVRRHVLLDRWKPILKEINRETTEKFNTVYNKQIINK